MTDPSSGVAAPSSGRRRAVLLVAGAAVLVVVAILAQRRLADADGDGVADRVDACAGTPRGRAVDAQGCCAAARTFTAAVASLRQGQPMEIGEAWFLQQLAAQRQDAQLQALVDDTRQRLAAHRAAHLLRPEAAPQPLPESPGRGIERLANYIFAPAGAPPERAAAFIDDFTVTPGTGYILTHQLLVLEWARSVGLVLPPPVAARRNELLAGIAAEQAADAAFSDLFAERAAILLAFTTPDAAEADRWIDVISAAAPADGRWLSPRSVFAYDGQQASANHPWVHTTGFVAAASGYYLQRRDTFAPRS